jgi:radical SAM-linked protein
MKFEKADPVKYISHLDMMRAFERAFRRGGLPLAFSEGFTPHPRLTFAPALSVGVTSSGEYLDAEFYEDIPAEEVISRLNSSLPEGLKVLKAGFSDDKYDLSKINAASYTVAVSGDFSKEDMEQTVKELLNQKQIIVDKVSKDKVRKVDIAPLIHCINVLSEDDGEVLLRMEVAVGQGGSVSPDMIIKELGKYLSEEIKVKHIHRENLFLKQEGINLPPL